MEKAQVFTLASAKEKFASSPRPAEIILGVTKLSELVFSKGDLRLLYYEPGKIDHQVPHDQEELYVVTSGTAELDHGRRKIRYNAGDSLLEKASRREGGHESACDFDTNGGQGNYRGICRRLGNFALPTEIHKTNRTRLGLIARR